MVNHFLPKERNVLFIQVLLYLKVFLVGEQVVRKSYFVRTRSLTTIQLRKVTQVLSTPSGLLLANNCFRIYIKNGVSLQHVSEWLTRWYSVLHWLVDGLFFLMRGIHMNQPEKKKWVRGKSPWKLLYIRCEIISKFPSVHIC